MCLMQIQLYFAVEGKDITEEVLKSIPASEKHKRKK